MSTMEEKRQQLSSSWHTKCIPISSSSSSRAMLPPPSPSTENHTPPNDSPKPNDHSKSKTRTPGGWKAMPYVLGNETFERLASIGLGANFNVFLMNVFHMEQAYSANLLNMWNGVNSFVPLIGAFISDAYVGKFWVIAFSSFATLLGMMTMTLIVSIPNLLPPACSLKDVQAHQCIGPTTHQMGFLVLALGLMSIGAGGIRPCSLPFGVDQFDPTTDEGRKGINSFFNWYYTTFTVVLIIAVTLVVYVQEHSWKWGFGIPTMLMVGAILLFFVGRNYYVYVKPEGSIFTGIVQALVAAYNKRKLKLPTDGAIHGVYYDPPTKGTTYMVPSLPLTNRFRFLNKAAIIMDGEVNPDGFLTSPWRLSSIQQIEEAKCLLKVIPILASGIICFTALVQQNTFIVSQALKMDRHLGPHFEIPAGTVPVINMITLAIWVPFYDRILVPSLQKITKIEGGITILQRIGIGFVFSTLAMVVSGLIEKKRRDSAIAAGSADGIAPITVMWLAPQLILMGFAEAFSFIGQIEFYYKEFPQNMKSVANSLFSVTGGFSNYISSALVITVHKHTGRHGRPDWLTADINEARLDYFYYLIAALGVLNMIYYLMVAPRYEYKTKMEIHKSHLDLELNDLKK